MRQYLFLIAFILLSAQGYSLKPAKKYDVVPDTLGLQYEKNTINTTDGYKLQSWTFLPAKEEDNKITLILAYADAGNMSWWLTHAAALCSAGFTVVLFDYRGFGESDSFKIDPKMLYYDEFATDLGAVIQFERKKYRGRKVGVISFSMGTIATTVASKKVSPDFIIADGFVTDPYKIKTFYAKSNDEIFLPQGAASYKDAVVALRIPMLIFSGREDEVTPDMDTKKFTESNARAEIVNFDGGHMQGFWKLSREYPGSEYVEDITRFVGKLPTR